LIEPSVGQRCPVDIRDAVAIGNEVDTSSVRRPLWVDVFAGAEAGRFPNGAACHVDQGQAVLAEGEVVEVGTEPVGHEGDPRAVRRPGRLKVAELVIGETPDLAGLDINDIQVVKPSGKGGEADLAPIRRPRWALDLTELGKVDATGGPTRLDIVDRQLRASVSAPEAC
jgi:hypothetical protein